MTTPRTTGRRAVAAARSAQALELRKAGLTYEAIGNALGVTRQAAHYAVTKVMQELVTRTAEDAAELRALELLRLDAMLSGLWAQAARGNLGAVDRVLRIAERRAKLLGLDAPTKLAPTNRDGDDLETAPTGLFIVPAEAESVEAWLAQTRNWREAARPAVVAPTMPAAR